jgi:hypothetical protein
VRATLSANLGAVLLCLVHPRPTVAEAEDACRSVRFPVNVAAEQRFEKTIGADLVFRLVPVGGGPKGQLDGWQMSITSPRATDADYIYPVNPPLRFNASQIFGAAYGMTVKESLATARRLRFLLRREDYDRLWPLVTNALWPYSAPRPDRAGDEYATALNTLRLGWLEVVVVSYDAEPDDSLRRLSLRVEITVPREIALEPGLHPSRTACPSAPND